MPASPRFALPRGRVRLAAAVAFLTVALGLALPQGPAHAVAALQAPKVARPDFDSRTGVIAPTAEQRSAVRALHAHVTWNRFGTPQSLIRYGGYLATGLSGSAVDAARSWLSTNSGLFRLRPGDVAELDVLADTRMIRSPGHAVIFRQSFGGLPAVQDGMITVGITGGKVAYASSSSAGAESLTGQVRLTPVQAWLRAASNVGAGVPASAVHDVRSAGGWTVFTVPSMAQVQRARLRSFPTVGQGARPAYETVVENVAGAVVMAYTVIVDADSGAVLFRRNAVQQLALEAPQTGFFQGTTGANGACGPLHQFTAPAGTKSIDLVASANLPADDIVLNLVYVTGGNAVVGSSDTATSPEAVHYAPAVLPPGTYAAKVCPFDATSPPFDYSGFYATQDTAAASFPYPPKWKYFVNAPPLNYASTDTRKVGCWETVVDGSPVPGCDVPPSPLKNTAARGPWDYDFRANQPTFTTSGNAAQTTEAWVSPLTPGGTEQKPVDPDRTYGLSDNPMEDWTNAWYTSKCDPSNLHAGGNDILAAVTNLFAGHNRFHDFAYFLGFTETNFNLQEDNFGNTAPGGYPAGREADPEIGNVQAGAVSGGSPTFEGRDNANQITLNDGIPGITNQYLFQPIAGAFYAPCVDGDLDSTVFGHEYTHAISNRMAGGPDSGLSGYQAGSMGESWSDLNALEYLHEYGLVPMNGENPWAEGPYVTGNKDVGIRDYALDSNPLNYSDLGFDIVGPEVHADGEIWNGTNYSIRQAFVTKYNGLGFPESDSTLQKRCADGIVPADQCPGNRRWIQIMYDAWLLMQPAVSMLDARDAYLAADVMRFGGADQQELWHAFASRGMGQSASSNTNADSDAKPSFSSPVEPNATLNFDAVARDEGNTPVKAKIYVGDYEARAVPVADTDPGTPLGASAQIVPGTYHFIAQADGYGLLRFELTLAAGPRDVRINFPTNFASVHKGATATGDGVNQQKLIDDTESTDWSRLGASPNVQGSQVTVKLAGGAHGLRHVQVSAYLHPADASNTGDTGSQSRFSALRQFAIQTCTASVANSNCSANGSFTTIYTSPADAFPAGLPRPLAPNLTLRDFDVPDTSATHVRLVVRQNECTGAPAYQGEQDNDPTNDTDCDDASSQGTNVRAAELQVFTSTGSVSAPGGGGGGADVTGHAHTDYSGNGKAGTGDVHVLLDVSGTGTPSGTVTYYDLRQHPPGGFSSNIRCYGTPTGVTRLSDDTVRINGTVPGCRTIGKKAKTFTMVVTDHGTNPPHADHYHFIVYGKTGNVLYDNEGDTTVGLGDLTIT